MAAARTSREAKAIAAAASIGAHLIFLAILMQEIRSVHGRVYAPEVTVDLISPLVLPKPTEPPRAEEARRAPEASIAPRPFEPPPLPPVMAVQPLVVAPRPSAPAAEDPALASVRGAVRESLGCDPRLKFRLNAAELEACNRHDRQYAAAKGKGVGGQADLDPEGRFIKPNPDDPYLTRMPQKGCKPRVGGAGGDGTSDDHFVPGITCVFRF